MDFPPRAPKIALPPGVTDCHMHIFGTEDIYPLSLSRTYTPPPAPLTRYQAMTKAVGIQRSVIVQPSAYGVDNRCTLDATQAMGTNARAIVGIDATTRDADLDAMHASGARGVRLNAASRGLRDEAQLIELIDTTVARIARLGWHLQIFTDVAVIAKLAGHLRTLPIPLVIDHMGLADAARGADQPEFRAMCELLAAGKCWVKLSGAYRVSKREPDFPDAAAIIRALIAANPDRLVWGSDWPHTASHGHTQSAAAPPLHYRPIDSAALLEQLAECAGDAVTLRKILVDNPAGLYGF